MKYIIGIGNPGEKYEKTRHNVGFRAIEALKDKAQESAESRLRWREDEGIKGWICRCPAYVLVKPGGYVNRSGRTVSGLIGKGSGIGLDDLLVVCDDANLDFGKLRLRKSGSAGGHHGLEDILSACASEEVARLRIGVRNARTGTDLVPFVLDVFEPVEEKALEKILDKAAEICLAWSRDGFGVAQNCLSRMQQKD